MECCIGIALLDRTAFVLCFAVLACNEMVMHRSAAFPLRVQERTSNYIKDSQSDFTEQLKLKLREGVKGQIADNNDKDKV